MAIKKRVSVLIILWIFASLNGFGQNNETENIEYIFIGHCYQNGSADYKVDYRLELFDFSDYQGIWLGGDISSEAMLNHSTIEYINSIFDLGNPDTHWSLGNHDARNGNWEWYEEFAGRKTYHVGSSNGITRVVLNTNLVPTDCESLNEQYQMIVVTCDTVKTGNNLILIMHHGIWRDVPGLPPPPTYAQSDLVYWNSNCYQMNSTFAETIYPKLVEAQNRGVNVYCVLGDMGAGPKSIDFLSDDGIHFLGCGLHHNEPEDKVLIFTLQPETNQLDFKYQRIDSLLLVQ